MGTLTHTMAGHLALAGASRPRVPGFVAFTGTSVSCAMHATAGIQGTSVKPDATWAYVPANRFTRPRWELSP